MSEMQLAVLHVPHAPSLGTLKHAIVGILNVPNEGAYACSL